MFSNASLCSHSYSIQNLEHKIFIQRVHREKCQIKFFSFNVNMLLCVLCG